MNTKQTWRINGQVYTHEQIVEMKKQGINPHTDKVIMKFVSPIHNQTQSSEQEKADVAKDENETTKVETKVVESNAVSLDGRIEINELTWPQIKKLGKERGMVLTNETKKADVIAYLETLI